ncbi:B12-binding domain-containing radical SAM protein [Streptomyces barringtoniae]|uniref:B12-binding domain-containing radical SAM protein n=1 Tax=Streptomyces barringtoniae TaxID=2892029 RepID=UPI001E343587|nr:radical SAM protein [Streptomyces barringtoniae]MCC5481228.1 B12-binding domain-containing radical SAM protein [Streptomyces barringtoniae]
MRQPRILLVNPPIWNVYAPHLAVPLLAAVMRRHGWQVTSLDLSIEQTDWLLSSEGLGELLPKAERRLDGLAAHERGAHEEILTVFGDTVRRVDAARAALKSRAVLADPAAFTDAATVVRNGLACVSASFPGLRFDLRGNFSCFSHRRSDDILLAAGSPDRNVYAWALERRPIPGLDDPDLAVAGISVSADTQLIAALTTARHIKLRRPDVHVVMGGNLTTRMVSRWQEEHPFFAYVDSFVSYEGEDALPALCDRITGGDDRPVPGLLERDGRGGLSRTPAAMVDVSDLPTPDFDGLPLDRYFAPGPVLPLQASRSCAWDCAFCSIPFASNKFRIRRPEQVVHDMAALAAKHGSDSFMFVDEIMTLTSLRGVSRELNDGGHELYWYGETRFSKGLDDELAAALRRSGCRRLDLGLESYNQRVLDLMRKGTKVDDIEPSLQALLGNKVPVHLFCMTGFPGETEEEALRTQEFAAQALRRSVEEFGVPYSTAANGPFILDVLSPVGERPDLFGVELIPPDEGEDLAFDLDYTVSTGLSRQDAARLTSGGPGGPAVGAAFHRGTWIGDAEEWSFLWALAEVELPARRVAVPAAPCPEVGRAATVRLADGVRGRVSVTGRGVLLHVPSCDALLDVPEEWRPLLDGRDRALADLWRDIPSPRAAAATLARLASHGALSVEQGSPDEELACVWYAAQPHLVRDSRTDGSCLLVSPETGRGVRVSAAGRLLWLLAADGATDAELAERSRLPERQRRLLLENLAEHRVIASAALAPGLLELPRVAA